MTAKKTGVAALLVPTLVNLLLTAIFQPCQIIVLGRALRLGRTYGMTVALMGVMMLFMAFFDLLYVIAFRPYPNRPWSSLVFLALLVIVTAWRTNDWLAPFSAVDSSPDEARGVVSCLLLLNLLFTLVCGGAVIFWKARRHLVS